MTAIFSLNEWFKIVERGTSGDQVFDILYSWKKQLDDWDEGLKADGWKESFILDVNRIAELEEKIAFLETTNEKWHDNFSKHLREIKRLESVIIDLEGQIERLEGGGFEESGV